MTNRDLAELRDPERKQAGWWKHIKGTEPVRFGDWEAHSTKSCGFVDVPFERVAFTGPDWHADDLACFRDWRPVLLAAGCRIECILDRTNMPRTCVVFGLSILDAGPTYRTPVLAAVAWLAEHKPELLREAIAQVEEGK